jgi:hypothetical protein
MRQKSPTIKITNINNTDLGKSIAVLLGKSDHMVAVTWAADCAKRVLRFFEKEHPKDHRPRMAIEEARTWVRQGKPMKMAVIRNASLDSHAAARETDDEAARAAARAAGQAVASVHVAMHALAAAIYAAKAKVLASKSANKEAVIAKEQAWQYKHLKDLGHRNKMKKPVV